ncbi:unnamed protein product, partial [Polarella glacialis]
MAQELSVGRVEGGLGQRSLRGLYDNKHLLDNRLQETQGTVAWTLGLYDNKHLMDNQVEGGSGHSSLRGHHITINWIGVADSSGYRSQLFRFDGGGPPLLEDVVSQEYRTQVLGTNSFDLIRDLIRDKRYTRLLSWSPSLALLAPLAVSLTAQVLTVATSSPSAIPVAHERNGALLHTDARRPDAMMPSLQDGTICNEAKHVPRALKCRQRCRALPPHAAENATGDCPSRGRTIRSVFLYKWSMPFVYSILWFGTFGGAAIRLHRRASFVSDMGFQLHQDADFYLHTSSDFRPVGVSPACAFSWKDNAGYWFDLMGQYQDMGPFLVVVSIITTVLYFVTSSDSGSLVVELIANNGKESHVAQRVFWAITEGAVAIALLRAGGQESLKALQSIFVCADLPFTVAILLMCTALWRVYPDAVAVGVSDPEIATNSGITVPDAFTVGVSDPETATGSAVTVTPSGPVFDTLSWCFLQTKLRTQRKDSKVLSSGDLSRYPWGMMMGIACAIAAKQKATSVLEYLFNAPENPSCTSDRHEMAVAHAASSQSSQGATGPEVTGKKETIQTGFKRRPAIDGGGKPSPGAEHPSKRVPLTLWLPQFENLQHQLVEHKDSEVLSSGDLSNYPWGMMMGIANAIESRAIFDIGVVCSGWPVTAAVAASRPFHRQARRSRGRMSGVVAVSAAAAGVATMRSSAGRSRRVAVVGGGPAGMATCRFLAEAGHQPCVFEAGSGFGGIWAPQPSNHVVYEGLVTNIPKVAMQSFELDFPEELPSYIKADELGAYFQAYADHFRLRPTRKQTKSRQFVRFGTKVTRVQPQRSEEDE